MTATDIETGSTLQVRFNDQGLVPAIVQDAASGEILMMAWMNQAALDQTRQRRLATFYSRSRDKMWVKGETSGHTLEVVDLRVDCDQDTILLKVKANGPACHVGYRSCFYRSYDHDAGQLNIVEQRQFDPDAVYKK